MRKTEVKPAKKARGLAPDAYYYLGRYLEDIQAIQSQHFENREEMEDRESLLEVRYFGSLEKDGLLQKDMNRYYPNILKDLKRDYPRFTRRNILLFSYTAARIPLGLISKWAQISTKGAVSSMKCKMKVAIACHACPRKEQYLELLSR